MKIQKRNRKFLGNDNPQSCKVTEAVTYQQLQIESLQSGLFCIQRILQSIVHFQKVKGLLTVLLFPKHRSNPPERLGERQISLCISASQNVRESVELHTQNTNFVISQSANNQNYKPKCKLVHQEDLINKLNLKIFNTTLGKNKLLLQHVR